MIYDKALIISRYHDDLANPIYNAYIRGIESQCKSIHFVDYFDQVGALGKSGFEQQIIDILEKEKINLIFMIFVSGDPSLDPYFIQKIAQNRFMAMVFWDTEQFFEQIDRYYMQLADLVLLPANYEYIYKLKMIGINAICPFSLFDSSKYKPSVTSKMQSIDVSFVGEVTKGARKEYISYLLENGINIQTYGSGTKNGKVSFEKVVEIFNTSKINLSFTGTYDNSVYTYCSNINNRIMQNKGKPIEIALCGGFVLTEYVPGIEKVFNENDIDTFLSKEELLEKINYYLENANKRIHMSNRAYEHAKKNYDSILAFSKIFDTIRSITPKKNKTVILDKVFIEIYNTFHIFYFLAFLKQGRIQLMIEELKVFTKNPIFIARDVLDHVKYYIQEYFQLLTQKRRFKLMIQNLDYGISQKEIVLYGAGKHTIGLLNKFPQFKNYTIKAIADSNPKLKGTTLMGIPVISPSEIFDYGEIIIISSFAFEKEILQHLKNLQILDANIIQLYKKEFTRDMVSNSNSYNSYNSYNIYNIYHKRQQTDPYQIYRNTLKLR